MAMDGAAADLVTDADAGVAIPPGDAPRLAAAIESMRGLCEAERLAMGERGRRYLAAHFTRDVVVPEYETLLQRVARTGAA